MQYVALVSLELPLGTRQETSVGFRQWVFLRALQVEELRVLAGNRGRKMACRVRKKE
jgi:hypothetical protein